MRLVACLSRNHERGFMKLITRGLVVAVLVCVAMLAHPETASANKCSAGKVKCVVNKTKALLGCHGKAAGKGLTVDAACVQKAKTKFDGGTEPAKGCFEKLEAKGEKAGAKPDAVCPTSNDTAALEAKVDAFVADLVADLDTTVAANKCVAGKVKCAATKAGALLGCQGKALGKSIAVDAACLAKAKSKFDGGAEPAKGCFEKLEAKGEKAGAKPVVVCPTSNDTAAIEAAIDAFVADVVCDLEPAGAGCQGPTPTPTATPRACGNGADPQLCDPSSAGYACGPDFACTNCNCACPSKVHFAGDATDAKSILDTGWTGIAHRAPIITNGDVTVGLACSATERPCGVCNITGPIVNENAGTGQLDNQRCSNDSSIRCTGDAPCTAVQNKCLGGTNAEATCAVSSCAAPGACTAGVCVGGTNDGQACCLGGACRAAGTCEFFFGSDLPLAAGGVTTCVVNQFNGQVVGTANVESGEAITTALLISRVFLGPAIDNPCPRCINDPTVNDGALGGTCDAGPRQGLTCDGNGSIPGRPDFGTTSLDCPPNPASIIASLGIDLSNATDPVTKTLTTNSPNCTDSPGDKCLCDTCNNSSAEACSDNSDCPDPAGPVGPVCGGRRCLGGANGGAPCSANTECPGVAQGCGRVGAATQPSGCQDDTTVADTLIECADVDGDGEGVCTSGPTDKNCSVASGHPQRGCDDDGQCGGAVGSCVSAPRGCLTTGGGTFQPTGQNDGSDVLTALGQEDPPVRDVSRPTLGAVFCIAPTGQASVNNVAGLPGPGRVTIRGTATGLP